MAIGDYYTHDSINSTKLSWKGQGGHLLTYLQTKDLGPQRPASEQKKEEKPNLLR
jgi:hypothetical protein